MAKYHRPDGEALQDGGVTPSHPLSSAELRRYYELRYPADMDLSPSLQLSQPGVNSVGQDPYIQKALEVLKESTTPVKKAA